MKVKIAMNGKIKFVLIPESDTEAALLKDASKTELDSHLVTQATTLIDEMIPDGSLIISTVGSAKEK